MPILFYLLAVAVFAQGTSEFVLAGILPSIATDLQVPLSQAGLLTSGFAFGMVIGAPVMAAASRRVSPRWTLSVFLILFIVAHVIGALTDSFSVLLCTRVIAALGNAGFLAVALSMVVRIVPPGRQTRALSVILSGTTLALVAGVAGRGIHRRCSRLARYTVGDRAALFARTGSCAVGYPISFRLHGSPQVSKQRAP